MTGDDDPVWVVYDLYRTARLNVKYYAARLESVERWGFWLDLLIAITAPASAVSGIWLLKTEIGQEMWKYLAGLAAIVAVAKPLLKLPQQIKLIEQCLAGYRALEFDVEQIVNRIRVERAYSKASQKMLDIAQEKKKKLVCNPPENRQKKALIDRFYKDTITELPETHFFVPEHADERTITAQSAEATASTAPSTAPSSESAGTR